MNGNWRLTYQTPTYADLAPGRKTRRDCGKVSPKARTTGRVTAVQRDNNHVVSKCRAERFRADVRLERLSNSTPTTSLASL